MISARSKKLAQQAASRKAQPVSRGGNSGKGNKVSSGTGTVDLKYARAVEIASMNTSG